MPTTSLLAPRLIKGAFIRLDETGIGAIPQLIVFQYNPETLTRKFKPYEKPTDKEGSKTVTDAKAQPTDPEEEFDVVLELDATDDLEEPLSHPTAVLAGVADRVAALEMLLYPAGDTGLLSDAVGALAGALGVGATSPIPDPKETPVVLFAWGPGRIVPVKITSFSVEEQAFNTALYPVRAKVTAALKILNASFFDARADNSGRKLSPAEEMAKSAYNYTLKQKKLLATANVINSLDSVLSMLPF